MRKEIKTCLKYYRKNINSDDYKEYLKKSEIDQEKNHQEFILTEKPSWVNRTDYFNDYMITNITICDVLSNNGVTQLLKKLYSLPKNKYKVKNYYKKPTIRNKYDYVKLKYTESSIGIFAEIEFLKDKYIKKIEITWSQINNYYACIEYRFHFQRCFNETLYNDFILDNIKKLTRRDYVVWYYISDKKQDNYLTLSQMNSKFFNLICQHYITSLLYSEQGKNHPLITLTFRTRKEPIDINTLYIGDYGKAFYNRKDNYIILGDFDKDDYFLCSGDNIIPNFGLCGLISRYRNEFFYYFFGERELKIFEQEFSRYASGRVKIRFNKKITSLLNKMQSISDYHFIKPDNIHSAFDESWDFYVGNDKENIKDWFTKSTEDYRAIYEKNFSYFKILSEINYTKSNHIISIFAAIGSILATIISIVAIFIK